MASSDAPQPPSGPSSPFLPMFESFRSELDEHHDRRERIIKASRDITAASKKIIFALQRYIPLYPSLLTSKQGPTRLISTASVRKLASLMPQNILKSTEPHQAIIRERFSSITADLQSINAYRYYRQVSGGIQEWMESLLFQHYLATQTLLSFSDALKELHRLSIPAPAPTSESKADTDTMDIDTTTPNQNNTNEPPPPQTIDLTPEDYLLGVFDMTGELMRFAITSIATSGSLPTSTSTSQAQRTPLTDLQSFRRLLSMFDYGERAGGFARDSSKKLEVTLQSVEKVERAMYGLVVRGSERPKGWVPPDMDVRGGEEIEGY